MEKLNKKKVCPWVEPAHGLKFLQAMPTPPLLVGTLTPLFNELLSDIKSFKPKLVVLDKALDLFGGDENNNSHVRQFIHRCCAYIAREVNSSVLLCKHGSIGEVWRDTIEFHIHAYLDEKSNYLEKKNNVHVICYRRIAFFLIKTCFIELFI
ncbi:MAG: AAA family ATPase [Wolbachia sp.]